MSIPTLAFLLYSISIIMPFILTACLNKMALPSRVKRGKCARAHIIQSHVR